MRPLQLSFSGIRSYPGAVGPLDFTGKTLIAIIGDTGAGKSTILEAITLALYGNCTWTDREHKALMAEGTAQMTVDFTFTHDGQRWRVRRVYHANTTPSSHLLQNLDTGDQIDNARAVNRKIEALLHLDFASFTSAVLLPQGKFDRLLTATGGPRTALLKSIFGVQAIETMRTRAGDYRERLTELIHQADLARRNLLDDPAAAAAMAASDAAQAEQAAQRFHEALGALRACQQQASAARDRHARLAAASGILEQQGTRDVVGELPQISAAAAELAALDAQAANAKEDRETRRAAARAELAAAAREGLTLESLVSAATLLDRLPGRLDTLSADQAWLDRDAEDISGQARQLETARAALVNMQARASSLAEKRDHTSSALEEYRRACGLVQDAAGTALRSAIDAGHARRDEQAAFDQMQDLQETIVSLESAAETAVRNLQSAEDHLANIRSHDAAHTAGADLSAGQPCLICHRPLPDDYQPPASADPAALQAADRSVKKARKADREAADELADARGRAVSAKLEHEKRRSATQAAQDRLEQARQNAVAEMQHLTRRQWGDDISSPGKQEFRAVLETSCSRLSAPEEDAQDELLSTSLSQLLGPARAAERELTATATAASKTAGKAETDLARESEKLSAQQEAHHQAESRLTTARKRHHDALAGVGRDLASLPGLVSRLLPAEPLAVTTGHVQSAQQAITERRERLAAVTQDRDKAAEEVAELTATQRQLDHRRQREVTDPLRTLADYLEQWQDTIEQAASVLPGDRLPISIPDWPEAITEHGIGSRAAALAEADRQARDELAQAVADADTEASSQLRKLGDAAALLRSGRQGLPSVALPAGEQLLGPGGLDPVIAAETSARELASRRRADQETAQGQIQLAASLDSATSAGRARVSAVDALRGLLGDAKFQQYLTDRRTHALLGVATGIFRRLSGGEFGFAEDFQIVSIRSGAARSPKTLSGGETFLASLALALALVEMHSRSGARLGALFLDEGFGSLDADALASSLAVLQAETGGDKLVAVISHLHAVAEAVEDVMWVERNPEGSAARWLDAAERDALVREDVTSGLLRLVS
jgi:DNA repair protein SbcC/Rad50